MDDDSARDGHPEDQWPLPPPWMWGCGRCAELYRPMIASAGTSGTPTFQAAGAAYAAQLRLARHLVSGHPADLPAALPDCPLCRHYADLGARLGSPYDWLGAEHRARHLFVPPYLAGLV